MQLANQEGHRHAIVGARIETRDPRLSVFLADQEHDGNVASGAQEAAEVMGNRLRNRAVDDGCGIRPRRTDSLLGGSCPQGLMSVLLEKLGGPRIMSDD